MTAGAGVIRTAEDLARGAQALAELAPEFAPLLDDLGPLPLRLRPGGFQGLCEIIISQQVSVASADAIRARMAAADLFAPAAVIAAGQEGLRAAGLSRPKARYVQALAEAKVDFDALAALPDPEVQAALLQLTGIGPWTAQIYAMFCLGRADVFAPGDLALQEAARALYDLPQRPDAAALAARAQAWSPWRSVAARALFAYYRRIKQREGL